MTQTINKHPEVELLFHCARTELNTSTVTQINTVLERGIDWSFLLQMAAHHHVVPLLYQSLNNTNPEAIPDAILKQLQHTFQSNARRNFLLTKELLKFLQLFEAQGISSLPYKGPALAVSIYGNFALRQFGDLDILVRKHHVLQAQELLLSHNYQPAADLLDEQALINKRAHRFVRNDDKIIIDLQWGISVFKNFSFPVESEAFWERLEPITLLGTDIHNFPPEDLLQILCVHGSRHWWERLAWICDIAELIRSHPNLDWERIIEQAETLGNKRMLFLGMFLAADMLDTILPKSVWIQMQTDKEAKALAILVRRQFLGEDKAFGGFQRDLFRFRMREQLRHKLWFLGDNLPRLLLSIIKPTEEDQTLMPLPAFLSFLHYILRPIRLIGSYSLRLLKK